jgi:hypothetical protein
MVTNLCVGSHEASAVGPVLICSIVVVRFLTDEGIEYLREYLNLPSDIVPATLKKSTRPLERVPDRPPRGDRFGGGDRPRRDYGAYCCTCFVPRPD